MHQSKGNGQRAGEAAFMAGGSNGMNMQENVIGSHRVTKLPEGPGVLANCCRQLITQNLLIPYGAGQLIAGPEREIF